MATKQLDVESAPRWDLSDLYSGPSDPLLAADEESSLERARRFAADFRGRIGQSASGGPTPVLMAQALERYEELLDLTYRLVSYAHLVHAVDTQRAEHGALVARAQQAATAVQTTVMFFELDWIALDDAVALPIIESRECARWRHFLGAIRRYKPHTLSEAEEIILTEKNTTGAETLRRLFDESTSAASFELEHDGRRRTINQSEALALLYEPDRQLRIAAHGAITAGLEKNTHLATFLLNCLVQDHGVNNRLKKFTDPAQARHLANEIDAASVEALLSACEDHGSIVQDYYRLKSRLLGIDRLYDYDRYAPIRLGDDMAMPTCDWPAACRQVEAAYRGFSPALGDIATEFFERHWIDADPSPGKRGGAFCSSTVPSRHPYILMNFTGRLNDVMTLAHELGHGVHQYLSRPHGILENTPPLTLAETASIFGEMLVFERLLAQQDDPRVKLSLLCSKLEDAFASIFRQAALTRFEQNVHAARAAGELPVERIDDLWLEANRPMHGDVVCLTQGYARWWSYIGHFYHWPFYCYAYSFGNLLVLALWKQYKEEGKTFAPRYVELLAAGGTDTPGRLVERMGLDIHDPGFWNLGLSILSEMVSQARELAETISTR